MDGRNHLIRGLLGKKWAVLSCVRAYEGLRAVRCGVVHFHLVSINSAKPVINTTHVHVHVLVL